MRPSLVKVTQVGEYEVSTVQCPDGWHETVVWRGVSEQPRPELSGRLLERAAILTHHDRVVETLTEEGT